MADKLVTELDGVGEALGKRLAAAGCFRVSDLLRKGRTLGWDDERFTKWMGDTCGANKHQSERCLSNLRVIAEVYYPLNGVTSVSQQVREFNTRGWFFDSNPSVIVIYSIYRVDYNQVKEIGNGIYCRMSDYKHAVKNTSRATTAARNLLIGVFKQDILLKSTVTGQTGRALEPERRHMKMIKLNDRAINTIIDFTLSLASKKGWEQKPCNGDRNKIRVQVKNIEKSRSHDENGYL